MKKASLTLLAAALAASACTHREPAEPATRIEDPVSQTQDVLAPFPADDLALEYSAGGNHLREAPYDSCWLGGKHQTVVVLRLEADLTLFASDDDCATTEPYAGPYYDVEATVIRAFPTTALGYEQRITGKLVGLISDYPEDVLPGDHLVASIRQSGKDWFLHEHLPVAISANVDDSLPTFSDLPGTWHELQNELAGVRAQFDTLCTEPYQHGRFDVKLMDDATYDAWIHTRQNPEHCGGAVVDPGPTGDPVGEETDDLDPDGD